MTASTLNTLPFGRSFLLGHVLAIGAGLLAGCSHSSNKSSDAATPAAVKSPAVVDALPAQGFAREWSTGLQLGSATAIELHLRDDAVFVYSSDHKSYLIDRASGQLVSIAPVTNAKTTLRPPVVLGDRIVYPTNSTLEIYNRRGHLLRSIDLGFAIRSDAAGLAPNTIYVGSDYGSGGRVSAINLNKDFGFLQWELNTFGGVSSKPAVAQNTIYVGGEDGRVYALYPDRAGAWGLDRSAFDTAGPIYADLVADDYGVYAASFDGKLYCLDRTTGKIKWMWFNGSPLTDAPVIASGVVYQISKSQGLVALDKTAGDYVRKPKWTVPGVIQFLAEDAKHAYVLKADKTIAALDKATGNELFTSERSDFVSLATNTTSPLIYATTRSGQVMAIKPILRAGLTGELVLAPATEQIATAR